MMIYITGDTHRDFQRIKEFTKKYQTTLNDYLIILGDVGLNYYEDIRDENLKKEANKLPIKLLCVKGNHEESPENVPTYETIRMFDGEVFIEKKYSNLIFLKDGEIYNIDNQKVLVIGGAYSIRHHVEMFLKLGYRYFNSEQIDKKKQNKILKLIEKNKNIDIILSHTCPFKYQPIEAFYVTIDEDKIDKTTEIFLDKIEEKVNYKKWYCGHFHVNKTIDKIVFLYDDIRGFNER